MKQYITYYCKTVTKCDWRIKATFCKQSSPNEPNIIDCHCHSLSQYVGHLPTTEWI